MLNRFLETLDRKSFLNFHIWEFSFHSFFKEYARIFFLEAMLNHPGRTILGLRNYRRFIRSQENLFLRYRKLLAVPKEAAFVERIKDPETSPLFGLGFCLKPYNPKDRGSSCPAGRANHECLYLERGQTREVCSSCAIFEIAEKCLRTGCSVYIMTSAKDIARDFLIPQIKKRSFPAAALLLCPYSLQAILPALFICGIKAFLFAYDAGYCKDYEEWRRADLGQKEERTKLSPDSWEKLFYLFDLKDESALPFHTFQREGNIFYPELKTRFSETDRLRHSQ
jgi:hypothetical protein